MEAIKETCGPICATVLVQYAIQTATTKRMVVSQAKLHQSRGKKMTQEDSKKRSELYEAETRERCFNPEGSSQLRWPWVAYDEEKVLCLRTISVNKY